MSGTRRLGVEQPFCPRLVPPKIEAFVFARRTNIRRRDKKHGNPAISKVFGRSGQAKTTQSQVSVVDGLVTSTVSTLWESTGAAQRTLSAHCGPKFS